MARGYCCNERPGPSVENPGIYGPGGGRIGAVVLSPFVKPETITEKPIITACLGQSKTSSASTTLSPPAGVGSQHSDAMCFRWRPDHEPACGCCPLCCPLCCP